MLLFSTLLPIRDTLTPNDFISLVIEWNQKSPYAVNVIPNLEWHGERNIRFGDDHLWMDIQEEKKQNIIAVRYEKREDDGVIWDTEYIMNFNDMKMSIRLERSYTADALVENSKFSTPYFITLLIDREYLEDDGDLPVMRTPCMIDAANAKVLRELVRGKRSYRLPVVYVSKTDKDEYPLDVNLLASRLKGVAHVLAQESAATTDMLTKICNGANEKDGAVGIYYPNPAVGHKLYLYRSTTDYGTYLLEKIVRMIHRYGNSLVLDTMYTWQGVSNELLRERLQGQREERLAAEEAKKKAEAETRSLLESLDEKERDIRSKALDDARHEADTILEGFEDDMQRLQKQIDELTRANEALTYENQGLKAKLDANMSVPVLYMGDEDEFYPGEVKDLLLAQLSEDVQDMDAGKSSRRRDIFEDIIHSNDYQKVSEKKAETIKRILKTYTGMTAPIRQELMDLGFEITDDGKHYKLTYYGDGRYQTIVAKSPSDVRSGKNNTRQIVKGMF